MRKPENRLSKNFQQSIPKKGVVFERGCNCGREARKEVGVYTRVSEKTDKKIIVIL